MSQRTARKMSPKKLAFVLLPLLWCSPVPAIVISEVMYHPQTDEPHNEYVEIYNEQTARVDLSRWQFTDGIRFVFTSGTILQGRSYLVIARDPATIISRYGISNVVGPFAGALDNNSDHVILRDPAGGIMAEVDYADNGKWPVAADGAGHSLSKFNLRGDPDDPDNWRASPLPGGTPGRDNGFQDRTEDTTIIGRNEVWRYCKGTSEASTPTTAWRQNGYDDSGARWLSGATGIGYSDGDDVTILNDMMNGYWCIFCRKTFTVADPSAIEQLILQVDHDDGFVAYLNGTEVGSGAMPATRPVAYNTPAAISHAAAVEGGALTILDITAFKSLLVAGTNVLAVQVHNNALGSTDLSFIPTLMARKTYRAGSNNLPVVINEVGFHTSGTQFIELYNKGSAPLSIGSFYLSNDPDNLHLFQIPAGTTLPALGRRAFLRSQLGFAMNTVTDRILLTSPTADVVVDGRVVEAGPLGMSEGRWPDGADEWFYMTPTTGTANAVVLTTSVVINEIMYHPPTNNDADEYVELYNAGASAVNLTGWAFSRGISFDFAPGTSIAPGQYLVIAKDRNRLISRYGLSPAIVLGNFGGTLDNGGEKLRLRDANQNVADEVTYADGGHWPEFADGYGSSLELIDPRQDNGNYQAWAPSNETSKGQWTLCSHSGSFNPPSNRELQEIQINLMGGGVALLDDVRISQGATDYLNSTFEGGATGWTIMGNHVQSVVTTESAHGGTYSLKMIATRRGDTGCNHIESDVTTTMPLGSQTYTISFWARWQWGNRVISVRLLGNGGNNLPETYMLPTPMVTGTPGAQNSAYRANLGPVFRNVAHSPVVPGPATPVQVTAQASDPNGIASVTLFYKADSDGAYLSTAMYDDGAHGDGGAGDRVYGGQIPARAAGQTVAFYVQGTDGLGAVNTWPTNTSRPALYRVANNLLSSTFPTYRIVLTAADENLMYNGRPHLSNEEMNCTFVFDEKEVYYNCGVRFIGSPFHRSGGGYTGLKVAFNPDQKLHGLKDQARVDDNGGGLNSGDIHDRISYKLQSQMQLPWCLQEWFYVALNGRENRVLEDTVPPGSDPYLSAYYRGDENGYLFEVDDRFWFTNDNDLVFSPGQNNTDARFDWQGSDKDVYRNNYEVRNHDNEDDYTSIVLMLNILNNTPDAQYDAAVANVLNVEEWFRLFAVRTCIGDWDFIARQRGKNCYVYWPQTKHHWDLFGWDSELTFASGNATMSIWSNFNTILRFQQRPRHLHFYYTYIKEMLDKYFTRVALDPWLDHYSSLLGVNPSAEKTFIDQRRAYLLQQLTGLTTTPIDILTNGGNPITVTSPTVALDGTAPVQVRWVRVSGVDYYLDWTGAVNWKITLPVPPGTNLLTLQFLDYDKNVVGSDSITIIAPVPPAGSILINAGAAYTASPQVTLFLFASGTYPVTQMQMSNDNATWTAWEAFAANRAWTLSAGDGFKAVYFRVRNTMGVSSAVSSDSIVLDSAPPTGSIAINAGAARTYTMIVTLNVLATDSGVGVAQMRFSDNTVSWSAWEPYAPVRNGWILTSGIGMKTVYVQFRDLLGNASISYSDTILYDPTPPLNAAQNWSLYK